MVHIILFSLENKIFRFGVDFNNRTFVAFSLFITCNGKKYLYEG